MSWQPQIGQQVWLNHPDGRCLGVVVGFFDTANNRRRSGQPIIERQEDDPPGMGASKKGDRFVIHPDFLLPMEHGSPEHRAAMEDGGRYQPKASTTISV